MSKKHNKKYAARMAERMARNAAIREEEARKTAIAAEKDRIKKNEEKAARALLPFFSDAFRIPRDEVYEYEEAAGRILSEAFSFRVEVTFYGFDVLVYLFEEGKPMERIMVTSQMMKKMKEETV